jgi:DNA polymerase-4
MGEQIAFELRKGSFSTGCVTIKIKYSNFEVFTKQVSIPHTSAEDEIIPVAKTLFHQLYKPGKAVRLLTCLVRGQFPGLPVNKFLN